MCLLGMFIFYVFFSCKRILYDLFGFYFRFYLKAMYSLSIQTCVLPATFLLNDAHHHTLCQIHRDILLCEKWDPYLMS